MTTTDCLRLTLEPDDDGTAELQAHVVANGFSGHGSAWFDITQLVDFGEALAAAFPLREPLELQGGYWPGPGRKAAEVHLGLRVYPIDGRGTLGCEVRLAARAREPDGVLDALQVELVTSHAAVQRFAMQLRQLAQGELAEAVLDGDRG